MSGVQCLAFSDKDLVVRMQRSFFSVQSSELRVEGLAFRVRGGRSHRVPLNHSTKIKNSAPEFTQAELGLEFRVWSVGMTELTPN